MGTKHTPGPWHIGMKPGPMVYGPYGEQVTSINVMLDAPENLANCRLIAAAPDMLAALEAAYPHVSRKIGGTTDGEPLLASIRAAIAKAKEG